MAPRRATLDETQASEQGAPESRPMVNLAQSAHASYRELLDFVASVRGIEVGELPLRLTEDGHLNASVTEVGGRPEISISTRLLTLLDLFNGSLAPLGADAHLGVEVDPRMAQTLSDQAIRMAFTMKPPGTPPPVFERIIDPGDFEDYRRAASSMLAGELSAALAQDGGSGAELRAWLEPIVRIFSDPDQRSAILTWQT